jgi:TonB family protein
MMKPHKFLTRARLQAFVLLLIISCVGSGSFIQAQEPPSEVALGITLYPRASYLQGATHRLETAKASTWMVMGAYHTDDSIVEVNKYFKEQAGKLKYPVGQNPIIKALLRDNWKVSDKHNSAGEAIFGMGKELSANSSNVYKQTSFGVMVLADSIVRIHLMSPHPSSEDNNKFMPGTMIIIIREHLPPPPVAAPVAGVSAEDDKAYAPRDVTRKARIRSRPEPELNNTGIKGTVILRAVLASNGKVTRIRVYVGLTPEMDAASVEAARKIKFEPAVKDGHYVSQYIQIEYVFQ